MITLEQAKAGMSNKVDQQVIDEFRRGSFLLDNLIFDNAVSAGTGGSTLGYTYVKLKTPSTAGFRPLNTEYINTEAIREDMTAQCKIFGGNFKLDRVLIGTSGAIDELQFQIDQKIKGAINTFHYTVINGDSAARPEEFDGLDVFLSGSSTEYIPSVPLDLSTSAFMNDNYMEFSDMMHEFVAGMDGDPDMFLVNSLMKVRIIGVAQRMGYYTRAEDSFGKPVDAWNNIPIIDLQNYYDGITGTTKPAVPINADGTSSIFGLQIAMDGFHGVSPTGSNIIRTALPDLDAPGVLKEGDVEAVMAVALKNSLKAGVFRNIKIK